MLKMVIFVTAIIKISGNCVKDPAGRDSTVVKIANAIADKYSTHCTVLLGPDNPTWIDRRKMFCIAKMLFDKILYARTLKVVTFEQFASEFLSEKFFGIYNHGCSKMLSLVYGFNNNATSQLKELSSRVRMGGPIWIMFISEKTSQKNFLEYVNIPFDANFLTANMKNNSSHVDLSESYRVSMNHPIRTSSFGKWTVEEGLILNVDKHTYYKRNDLEGIKFNVGSLHNPPMRLFIRKPNGEYDLEGHFPWIWKDLQSRLNFTSTYIKTKEFSIGHFNGKEWTSLIGMTIRNELQVVVSEVTMVPARMEIIDFLRPLFITRYQLFFKEPGLLFQWDGYLRPFQKQVWLTIIVWLIGCGIIFKILYYLGLKWGIEDIELKHEFSIHQCSFLIIAAFLQQGSAYFPKSTTCRLAAITCYIVSLFLIITYSGVLTSFIAVQKPVRPFDSLESFLADGTYTMEQIVGTAAYAYFSNSSDPTLQQIYQKLFPKTPESELPQSYPAALEHVCSGNKIAHFGEYDILNVHTKKLTEEGCRLLTLEKPMDMVFLSFIVKKYSPFRKVFDFHLNRMSYQGILHRFQHKAMPRYRNPNKTVFKPVIAEQVVPMYFILLAGILMSVTILVLEIYLKKRTDRKKLKRYNTVTEKRFRVKKIFC